MSDPHFPSRVPWPRRLLRRWQGLMRASLTGDGPPEGPGEPGGGFWKGKWDQGTGFLGEMARRWQGLDISSRAGVVILLGLTVMAAGVLARHGGAAGGERVALGGTVPGTGGVVLAGLVWAAACAAAASALPLWGFAVAGFWLANHGLVLMAPLAGSPLMLLPVGWLVILGLCVGSRRGSERGRRVFPAWVALCLGAGWFLSGPLGATGFFGGDGLAAWMGKLGLKGVARDWAVAAVPALIMIPAWGWRPWFRRHRWTDPGFGRVLGGSVMVMGTGLALAAGRDAVAAKGWAAAVMDDCAYAAMLAWFWLAGGFALSLLKWVERGTGIVVRGITMHGARRILPLIWVGVTTLEWLSTHETAVPFMDRIGPGRLDHWMASWPWEIRVTAWGHAWAGVVVLTAGAGFLWQGREGVRMLPRLHSMWAASFICILAVSPSLAAYVTPVPERAGQLWWWAPLVLLGGIFQDLSQTRRNWRGEADDGGLSARLGWRIVLLGVLLALELRNELPWPTSGGVVALLGMLHLALPRALHRWWTRGRPVAAGGLPVSTQLWIAAAGMVSVLPMLHHDAQSSGILALAPVGWLPVLLWLRWRRPGLTMASGALAGALLGSCTAAAWCRPDLLLPEVPVLSFFNAPPSVIASVSAGVETTVAAGASAGAGAGSVADFANNAGAGLLTVTARPFLNAMHFSLLLLLTAAGSVLGALIFRSRPPMGEIPIAIAEPAA